MTTLPETLPPAGTVQPVRPPSLLSVLEQLGEIPEEAVWLAGQRSARTRRAEGLEWCLPPPFGFSNDGYPTQPLAPTGCNCRGSDRTY